jgi:predicted ATPase
MINSHTKYTSNSSRDEIHEKNSRIHLGHYRTNGQIAKKLKITSILDKLLEMQEKLDTACK